jgi:hypothetical protein
MSEVLDYFSAHDKATMAAFQTQGIGRYLTSSPQDVRQLTPQEVKDAHDLGLSIHLFYEMNPTYLAYFTFAQGAEDCRQAQARLAELGAPDGTVVARAAEFAEELLVADLDLGLAARERDRNPLLRDERPELVFRALAERMGIRVAGDAG